jgi:dipeptidyl aminopeptidase/acylaminoacyl peptidase
VTADGVPLVATHWPGRRSDSPAILLLHGINAHRGMFTDQARWLNGLGYAVLALDFRGHGGSAPAERTFGWREAEDAAAAFDYLRRDAPGRKIGVIGISMGGAAALLGRGGPLPADSMVLHAVYPDIRTAVLNRLGRSGSQVLAAVAEPLLSYQSYLRYSVAPDAIAPIEGLKRFKGAVLVIGGTEDRDTTMADSRALYTAAAGPKALWLVEDVNHVEVSKLDSPEYRARVRRFFAQTLGEPTVQPAGLPPV